MVGVDEDGWGMDRSTDQPQILTTPTIILYSCHQQVTTVAENDQGMLVQVRV